MASDSRTNAGHDQVNVARKMHVFAQPGERVFILLSSGSLSCTQSIITRQRRFTANDPDLVKIGVRWEQALRQAVARLPQIRFRVGRDASQPQSPQEESIVLVEPPNPSDVAAVQASQRPPERGA